jgi:transglutaminase superfamily protein
MRVSSPHAELAAILATELGAFDHESFEHGLDALACASGSFVDLGDVVRSGALAVYDGGSLDDLLIDRVVATGRGHDASVAVVLCELGRRAGMPVGVVAADGHHFVGHEEVSPWVLDPRSGELVDARRLPPDPVWRCAHEVADVLLTETLRRCERDGDLTRALQAATLRCGLPFDEAGQEHAATTLHRLRARLN